MTKAAELAKMGEVLTNSQIGGRRNIVINGAMNVAQRGTSSTGLGASAGYFTLDRYRATFSGTAGRLTMTQTADGPNGFANCLKLDCTTADTSIGAGEYFIIQQKIEGQDLQQLKKGTSDAEEFTVSFYVKGNASATYVTEIFDLDHTRQVSKTFSVTTDWTRVTLTFPADTTGVLGDDNLGSLQIGIFLHAGSNYSSGTLNSSAFAANTNANRAAGISSFFDSTDRTFFLTGLQMEVGSQATPFEHRSFAEEMSLCKRYYQRYTRGTSAPSSTETTAIGAGIWYGAGQVLGTFMFPIPMRVSPTASVSAANAIGCYGSQTFREANDTSCFDSMTPNSARININQFASNDTAGEGTMIQLVSDNDYFDIDAEL